MRWHSPPNRDSRMNFIFSYERVSSDVVSHSLLLLKIEFVLAWGT